jgi:hypothetical protein
MFTKEMDPTPCFDAVVGIEWSNDTESYAGGNVSTSRAFHARQVKGGADQMDSLVLQVGGWAWSEQLHLEKHTCYETSTKASEFESKGYEDSGKDFVTWNFRQIRRPGLKCRNKYAKRMLRCRKWRSVEDTQT